MSSKGSPRSAGSGRGRLAASFDVRSLETFVRVVEAQGFSPAARALGMTQPAVSLTVQHLEEELGAQLIDRSRRPLRATVEGAALYRHATRILAEVRALDQAVGAATTAVRPDIRIGIVASINALGAPLIEALRALSGELRIWSTLTPVLAAALRERELDMLITSEGTSDLSYLEQRVVMREPFVLALPRDFAAAHPQIGLAQLARALPFIRYTSRSNIGQVIERHLQRRRLTVPRRLEFDTSDSVVELVAAGLGWAIVTPLCMAESGVDFNAVALRPLDGPPLTRQLQVLARPHELPGLPERVCEVVAGLIQELLDRKLRGRHAWMLRAIRYGDDAAAG